MPENEHKDKPAASSGTNAYLKYSGLGFQMIAIIGLFTYAGFKIDQSAQHTTKWVTAIFALLGVFVSLYIVIRSVRNM